MENDLEKKQSFLRQEILEKGYDTMILWLFFKKKKENLERI